MRRKILSLIIVIGMLFFFLPVNNIKADYTRYNGTYKGTWRSYDMTCPKVYNNNSGKITLKITMKAVHKFTGKLKFGSDAYYKMTGTIKNKKMKLHYKFDKKHTYDYNGSVKKGKIKMIAFNNDALGAKQCLTGWMQIMKATKK